MFILINSYSWCQIVSNLLFIFINSYSWCQIFSNLLFIFINGYSWRQISQIDYFYVFNVKKKKKSNSCIYLNLSVVTHDARNFYVIIFNKPWQLAITYSHIVNSETHYWKTEIHMWKQGSRIFKVTTKRFRKHCL